MGYQILISPSKICRITLSASSPWCSLGHRWNRCGSSRQLLRCGSRFWKVGYRYLGRRCRLISGTVTSSRFVIHTVVEVIVCDYIRSQVIRDGYVIFPSVEYAMTKIVTIYIYSISIVNRIERKWRWTMILGFPLQSLFYFVSVRFCSRFPEDGFISDVFLDSSMDLLSISLENVSKSA